MTKVGHGGRNWEKLEGRGGKV